MLNVQGVTVRYGEKTVLDNVSFSVESGDWLMVAGPNGAGKSTLVSAIAQCVPYEGRMAFDGADVQKMKPTQLAKSIGVLSQQHWMDYAFSLEEVVALGRYAHRRGVFSRGSDEDQRQIDRAMERMGLWDKRRQSVLTLSGGELQRAFLAQVLAQNPRLLVLDEPMNHLDLPYQQQTFSQLLEWLRTPGRAVLSVVHDLSLAKAYGTKTLLMNDGQAAAFGPTRDVLCPANLQAVYGMDVSEWMRSLLAQWTA